jgi:succinyl-diaminopimelate desuccinylase
VHSQSRYTRSAFIGTIHIRTDTMNARSLTASVAEDEKMMVDALRSLIRMNAVGPESDGPGEAERSEYLVRFAKKLGFKSIDVYESKDNRVPSGKRPNIVIRVKGTTNRKLWVVTHMDTVPIGDPKAWKYPPFGGKVVSGKIYGRGSEDNGQELVSSLFGLRALLRSGISPELDVGLVFVADEEHGNTHGIDFLIKKKLFVKGDLAVVPDHGEPSGDAISVVEKSIAWVDVEVIGRQTHGSTPEKGINAFEVAARFMAAAVDRLRKKFTRTDSLFEPPISTFTPTKCDSNGPNVNTVPGRQTFSFDFRVLPEYKLDDVLAVLQKSAKEFEKSTGAKINVTFSQRAEAAPRTPIDSEVVVRLSKAIKTVRGVDVHPVGIGGGTCAAPFRRIGIEAAVWSTIPGMAHDANEFANVKDLVADAQVYALLFAGKNLEKN